MKKFLFCISVLALSLQAADKFQYYSIQDAMDSELAKQMLDKNFEFKFGKEYDKKLKIVRKEVVANSKTRRKPDKGTSAIKNKSAKKVLNESYNTPKATYTTSCQRAFISSMMALQQDAKSSEATKIVNITSYYKKRNYDSADKFECAIGSLMIGVALKADIAK